MRVTFSIPGRWTSRGRGDSRGAPLREGQDVVDAQVTDEDLVVRARAGDEASLNLLLLRYRRFARAKARSYFLVGAEHDDVVQEGMIGVYKAVQEFDPALRTSFRTFAAVCVSRQIITAVKTATRHKHRPLNDYVSFHRPVAADGDDERTLADVLPASRFLDPAEQVLCAERIRELDRHVDTALSDLETEVLRLHLEGRGYQEIARMTRRSPKSVDNALQRIKRKLGEHLSDGEAEVA